MLRYLFVLSSFLALCLAMPSQSQTSVLPFAYVIQTYGVEQNSFIMDVLSGEILYAFDSDEGVCPTSLSDDGAWFVYSHELTNNFIMNVETSEIHRLEQGIINQVVWSSQYNMAAFHYNQYPVNHVFVFGTTREEFFFDFPMLPSWASSSVSRFTGIDLVSVAIEVDTHNVTVYRANRNNYDDESFEFDARQDWGSLRISPNGKFLLAFGINDGLYTMNLETGDTYELGTGDFGTIDWLPSAESTLAYVAENENGIIQLNTLAPDADVSINTEIPFSVSPDGTYVYYKLIDAELSNMATLWLLNTESNQQTDITYTSRYSSQIQWLSPSQFVYRYSNPNSENMNITDLYFYDAETHENRQLTDTPDLEERFDCFRG